MPNLDMPQTLQLFEVHSNALKPVQVLPRITDEDRTTCRSGGQLNWSNAVSICDISCWQLHIHRLTKCSERSTELNWIAALHCALQCIPSANDLAPDFGWN